MRGKFFKAKVKFENEDFEKHVVGKREIVGVYFVDPHY